MALRSTITKLQSKQHDGEMLERDRVGFIEQWKGDVEVLYENMTAYLSDYVLEGAIEIGGRILSVNEELLGTYSIKEIVIDVAGVLVRGTPIARLTVGGTGRVDLYREDRPSEQHRLYIIRGAKSDAMVGYPPWMIESREGLDNLNRLALAFRGGKHYVPLDRKSLEEALDHLLNLA